ncbi:MAG: UbiA family prenyltransferase [Chloroherpetonaceae bacterium]|nr:UbiA family prenyltransferase [Chloroherpetonaceae bacterium]MDW8438148.1 UbiA family prenyltransferase [Chloroherpetonaceae bacterium]
MNYLFRNKIHLSLLSALGAAMWSLYFGIEVNAWCVLVVFLLTFSIYQYNRLTDDVEDAINNPDGLNCARQASFLIENVFFYALTVLALFISLFFGGVAFGATLFIALVGFLYNQKCFPDFLAKRLGGARRLKDMYVVKNLAPPVDWATAMVVLPLLFAGETPSLKAWICWGYIFICAFFIEVMWDIRDRKGDLVAGIKTIANTFSLWRTKVFLVVSSALSGMALFLVTFNGVLPQCTYFLLSNNLAVMFIASSYQDDRPEAARWISDMTIVLALLLFASFAAIAYFSRQVLG